MRTRSQSRNSNRQQQQVKPTFVEPFNLVEPIENQAPPVVTMDDNCTMAQLLEAPTEGYEDAIVVPEITADNFELKHGLLTNMKRIFRKGRKTKPKTTKLGTEWKSVKRRSQKVNQVKQSKSKSTPTKSKSEEI
ncbi:hypothetical protein Tco_1491451 [Tanacetum coccineum]